jgi:hypothetical protein
MADKKLCKSITGKSKICYRSEAAAHKAARATQSGLSLKTYVCPICRSWHLTKEEPHNKAEAIPSAAKLRRRLENYTRLLAAQQRKFDESQAALRAAEKKAEQESAEITRALEVMYARQHQSRI